MGPGLGTRGLAKPGQVIPPSDLVFLIYKGLGWPLKLRGNLVLTKRMMKSMRRKGKNEASS